MSDFERVRSARRSCREFFDRPVEQAVVEALVGIGGPGAAGWAYPSAHDLRPVSLEPVSEGIDRNAIEAAVFDQQPWLVQAPVLLAITADLDEPTGEFLEQDPAGLRGRDFVMIEAGALAQTVLLTCTDLGLGAVLVAGVRQAALRQVLGGGRHVVGLVALGYPTN